MKNHAAGLCLAVSIVLFFCSVAAEAEQNFNMSVQSGHRIACMDIAPDSSSFCSGGTDGTVKLWNMDGKVVKTLYGHTTRVDTVAFSPDGRYIVSGSLDRSVIIWDRKGQLVKKIDTGQYIWDLSFSADGKDLLLACEDPQLRILHLPDFSMRTVDLRAQSQLAFGGLWAVHFVKNDTMIAFGGNHNHIHFYDRKSMSFRKKIRMESKILEIKKDAKGYVIARSANGWMYIIDPVNFTIIQKTRVSVLEKSGKASYRYLENFTSFDVIDKNGSIVTAYQKGNKLKFWDSRGNLMRIISLKPFQFSKTAVSPDGAFALCFSSGSEPGSFVILDLASGTQKKESPKLFPVMEKILFSEDTGLFVGMSAEGRLFTFEPTNNDVTSWDVGMAARDIALFNDGSSVIVVGKDNKVGIWNLDGELGEFIETDSEEITAVASAPDGSSFVTGSEDGTIIFWYKNGTIMKSAVHDTSIKSIAYSPDGLLVAVSVEERGIKLWTPSGKFIRELSYFEKTMQKVLFTGNNRVAGFTNFTREVVFFDINGESITITEDEKISDISVNRRKQIFVCLETGRVNVYRFDSLFLYSYQDRGTRITSMIHNADGNRIVTSGRDARVILHNTESGQRVSNLYLDENTWMMYTDDGYWDGSQESGELVMIERNMRLFGIDQFAVRNNRPDVILKRLGNFDNTFIEHYQYQYQKRLRKLGLTDTDLSFDLGSAPKARVLSTSQTGRYFTLRLQLDGMGADLKSWNIYVNDVPIFGAYGRDLADAAASGRDAGRGGSTMQNRGAQKGRIELTERIELSAGENKIEVSCMNEAGAEAFRPVVYANYNGPVERDLYYIGFGVSEYRDESLDLRYAHKDAVDLGKLFGSLVDGTVDGNYRRVITRTYTDEEVTRENIAAAKALLEQASVDDTVVLMISGHGVHDRDKYATYYYLTHETDLDILAHTAVEFEELEELLQGIPPRRKLFLMDTCGSGEWDPEMVQKVARVQNEMTAYEAATDEEGSGGKGVWPRMPAGLAERAGGESERGGGEAAVRGEGRDAGRGGKKAVRGARTYLADKNRYIYNDLVRRSGAIVFSSCRGDEVSYESAEYENGLFTEYIIRGLGGNQGGRERSGPGTRPADTDGDGVVTTEELRRYVRTGVAAETKEDPLLYAVPQHPTVDRDNIYVEFGF